VEDLLSDIVFKMMMDIIDNTFVIQVVFKDCIIVYT